MNALLVIGGGFAGTAAVIHFLIFVMESVLWSSPSVWKRFGLRTQHDADTIRPMAFNQGFYNAFLAIGAVVGLVMLASSNWQQGGIAVVIFACGSMVLASVVLASSSPRLGGAALVQGLAPLLAIVFLVAATAT